MPPCWLGPNTPVIMGPGDEIASSKAEVSKHRNATQREFRLKQHYVTIKQGVEDINKFLHELRSCIGDISRTLHGIVSGPVPNRSNWPENNPERIKFGRQPNHGS